LKMSISNTPTLLKSTISFLVQILKAIAVIEELTQSKALCGRYQICNTEFPRKCNNENLMVGLAPLIFWQKHVEMKIMK
jgi:hypothetical protein